MITHSRKPFKLGNVPSIRYDGERQHPKRENQLNQNQRHRDYHKLWINTTVRNRYIVDVNPKRGLRYLKH